MKKIFTYITLMAAVLLTACTDDDIAQSSTQSSLDELGAVTGTMASVAEFEEGVGDNDALTSKSQLYYDRVNSKMKFNWTKPNTENSEEYKAGVDHIGIFAATENEEAKATQMDFMIDPEVALEENTSSVTAVFVPKDGGANPIHGGTVYYTYSPYKTQTIETGNFTYEAVPISYLGQTQRANEQMGYYFASSNDAFLTSEKEAASHLSQYTYLISDATATAGNHAHFTYSYVGSIVRFYMICPSVADDNIFYDSLQVYNSQADFTREATMNLATKAVTPTKTSHVMSLGFSPAIDMTCNNNHESSDPYQKKISYYWKEDGTRGYIMAYMMVSPINLSVLSENSTLYLIGRKAAYYTYSEYLTAKGKTPGQVTEEAFNALPKIERMKIYETKAEYQTAKGVELTDDQWNALDAADKMKDYERKVYKKTGMSKLNFQAGKHHQWSVSGATADDPITFDEITIQQWAEGPGFTNENGAGTADW